jgi:hypothetical protein
MLRNIPDSFSVREKEVQTRISGDVAFFKLFSLHQTPGDHIEDQDDGKEIADTSEVVTMTGIEGHFFIGV